MTTREEAEQALNVAGASAEKIKDAKAHALKDAMRIMTKLIKGRLSVL